MCPPGEGGALHREVRPGRCHCVAGGCPWRTVREGRTGVMRLLASRLVPVLSKVTHPPNYLPLHRLWAQLSLVVIVVFPAVTSGTTLLGLCCVPACGGRV